MAIQISGCTVIDNSRNINANVGTFTALAVPPAPISFSPADGATVNPAALNSIQITFSISPLTKGTGNITLRSGSANGTILETIAVSSGTIAISGGVVTINPASDNLPGLTDVYVVVDEGAFRGPNDSTVTSSRSILINTYNFTIGQFALGSSFGGGYLICNSSPTRWVVSPYSAEVSRSWALRDDANTIAQQVTGCTGWFVPTISQLQNPGYICRSLWGPSPCFTSAGYWSSTSTVANYAYTLNFSTGVSSNSCLYRTSPILNRVRSFRTVSY